MAVKCLLGCHVVTEALADKLARAEVEITELTALNGLLSARLASMKPRRPWWRRILWRNNPDG